MGLPCQSRMNLPPHLPPFPYLLSLPYFPHLSLLHVRLLISALIRMYVLKQHKSAFTSLHDAHDARVCLLPPAVMHKPSGTTYHIITHLVGRREDNVPHLQGALLFPAAPHLQRIHHPGMRPLAYMIMAVCRLQTVGQVGVSRLTWTGAANHWSQQPILLAPKAQPSTV